MNGALLRDQTVTLGITLADFARLVRVTNRAVNLWVNGERSVPGPVESYLDLLLSLPKALQTQELAKLKSKERSTMDGMYAISFRGRTGSGYGVLVFQSGVVFGSDWGVLYDGTYAPNEQLEASIDVELNITVPPGVALVQGVPGQKAEYRFDLHHTFDPALPNFQKVKTPYGPVFVKLELLRKLPAALAA